MSNRLFAMTLLASLLLAPAALAESTGLPSGAPPPAHRTPDLDSTAAAALWRQSVEAEVIYEYGVAAELKQQILDLHPEQVHTHWRAARDLVRAAEAYFETDPGRALDLLEQARDHAETGKRLDPGCSECCLYEFSAVARQSTTIGILSSLGLVREMGPILETCLRSPPTWEDQFQSEEASLYYGASQFFRLAPDLAIAEWVVGFRGDAERALKLARRANERSPDRVAYRAELGTALLCYGDREGDEAALSEAKRVIRTLPSLSDRTPVDAEDRVRLRHLSGHADEACDSGRGVKND